MRDLPQAGQKTATATWGTVCRTLKHELGEAKFIAYFESARLEETDEKVCIVVATGVNRDWVRLNAWPRINEVWAEHAPDARPLELLSRMELDRERSRPQKAPVPSPASGPTPIAKNSAEKNTFDTFVVGAPNEFPFAVARRVASWSDGHFNPVFFHAPCGQGKTHLLQAIARAARESDPEQKVTYLPGSGFSAMNAAQRETLLSVHLLLIDDVHVVAGQPASAIAFDEVLVELVARGARVVVSSDRSPYELVEVPARLRSELQCGLVVGIESADRELRVRILERKLQDLAAAGGFPAEVRPEVLGFLADRFSENVRALEGALNTLVARLGKEIRRASLEEVEQVLRPHLPLNERRITVSQIQRTVAEHYHLTLEDFLSGCRARAIARPRQVAMWFCKQITTRSLPDIGRRFGGRDHTTVLHAVRRIEGLKKEDPAIQRDIEVLYRQLGQAH